MSREIVSGVAAAVIAPSAEAAENVTIVEVTMKIVASAKG